MIKYNVTHTNLTEILLEINGKMTSLFDIINRHTAVKHNAQ